jgi:hypothetical protein
VQENEEEEAEDAVFVNYNDVMQEINIDEEGNGNSTDLDCSTQSSLHVHLC